MPYWKQHWSKSLTNDMKQYEEDRERIEAHKQRMVQAIIDKVRGTCSDDDLGEYAQSLRMTTVENVEKEYTFRMKK